MPDVFLSLNVISVFLLYRDRQQPRIVLGLFFGLNISIKQLNDISFPEPLVCRLVGRSTASDNTSGVLFLLDGLHLPAREAESGLCETWPSVFY